ASWTLRPGGIRDRRGRGIYLSWLAGSKRSASEHRARWRSRGAVLVAELFLVGDNRYCGRVLGIGVGFHEYGESDRSGTYGYSHSVDRCSIRLDHVVSGRGWAVRGGCAELAGRRSVAATHGSVRGC